MYQRLAKKSLAIRLIEYFIRCESLSSISCHLGLYILIGQGYPRICYISVPL
jgi:hypothetical protein